LHAPKEEFAAFELAAKVDVQSDLSRSSGFEI
jgi:hypothetical protein